MMNDITPEMMQEASARMCETIDRLPRLIHPGVVAIEEPIREKRDPEEGWP